MYRENQELKYTPNVYTCGTKVVKGKRIKISVSECIQPFVTKNNFKIVDTLDDGNCFYDTLSKYGEYNGYEKLNRGHMDLRREIIGTMIDNKDRFAPFFVANETVSPAADAIVVNAGKELEKFLKSEQWSGWMGDIVPQVASNILGVNIVIYDLLNHEPLNRVDRIEFNPEAPRTVNMLRTNGSHFRLLLPIEPAGVVAPGTNASRNTAKNMKPDIKKLAKNITVKKLTVKKLTGNKPTAVQKQLEQNTQKAITASLKNAPSANSVANLTSKLAVLNLNKKIPESKTIAATKVEKAKMLIEKAAELRKKAIELRKKADKAKSEAEKVMAAINTTNATNAINVISKGLNVANFQGPFNFNNEEKNNVGESAIEEQRKILEHYEKLKKKK